GDRLGHQVEAAPDRPYLGWEVEEAVQHAADQDLLDVHAGPGRGGGECLARRAQVVVLGVQYQGGAEAVPNGAGGGRVAVGRAKGPAEVVLAERVRLPLAYAEERREFGQRGGEPRRRRRSPRVERRVYKDERGRDPPVAVAQLEGGAGRQVPA